MNTTSAIYTNVSCGCAFFTRCIIHLLFFVGFSSYANSQMKISMYANPLVQRFGNMDKISTEYGNPNLIVHYNKIPSMHFGAEVIFSTTNKYNFVAGIQHVSNRYKVSYDFFAPNSNQQLTVVKGDQMLRTESLGFKVGVRRQLNSHIFLQADLGFTAVYKPKDKNLKGKGATPFGYYIDPEGNQTGGYTFIYKYRVSVGGFLPQLFIPELSGHFKLIDNLYLKVGTQLKFFDFDKSSGYIDIKVDGQDSYFEGVVIDKPLHFSRIKRTEFNYYVGLSYIF